ncbi:glycoside hydrolase family 3 N-terminal domain-containing protein [Cerasicoccus frondis]|uniref:glycoside hydrolase family 3 N-terminal domain-containing protein n=1 Tax=Cerasicoccus frondis TaxID=490090 RepID=UPI002852CBFD|nr:glycoside hydrolase family 3 N-terminal domain-containing protein [Cerasicoccus frondis]
MKPYQNPELPIEERVNDLLGQMTLDEKIGQLNQVFGLAEDDAKLIPMIRDGKVGSRILATSWHAGSDDQQAMGFDSLNECQRVAVEESRLGIPLIYGRDVIHGHLTIFPIPLGQAASWNPDLVERASSIAAKEAAADYVHWTFAPMLDIARDSRWGRVIEGCGEDAWLCSQLGRAMVRGFQGDNLADPERILACAKHFVGYGAVEGGRDYNTVEISENTLRNVYLPPFQAAVDEGVGTVMCAFNDLNGQPCSTNGFLLDEVLRQEWGFEGFVISDWDSIKDTVKHGTSADFRDAAAKGLQAGVDMEMVDCCYSGYLKELIEGGAVSLDTLDRAVSRILRAKFRIGLFERPYTPNGLFKEVHLLPEHRDCARELATQSAVLLKNKGGVLPLDAGNCESTALLGPLVDRKRELLGNWTLDGRAEDTVSILEAFQAMAPSIRTEPSAAPTDTHLRMARRCETVVLVVGEDHLRNGENANIADLSLPPGQEALIAAIHAIGKKIVLIVCSGRPLVLTKIEPMVDAILWAWHPGTEGGSAIADLVFGRANPSGKLPISFPRATGQTPIYYNHKNTCRPVDDYYGDDSRYQDVEGPPLYRFGFGLSYTEFDYSEFTLDRKVIAPNESVVARVRVSNKGSRQGDEIVQCYIRDLVSSTTRPIKELKGFKRISLAAGESAIVEFSLGFDELSFVGAENKRVVEPGEFQVWIGGSCMATLGGSFQVK